MTSSPDHGDVKKNDHGLALSVLSVWKQRCLDQERRGQFRPRTCGVDGEMEMGWMKKLTSIWSDGSLGGCSVSQL